MLVSVLSQGAEDAQCCSSALEHDEMIVLYNAFIGVPCCLVVITSSSFGGSAAMSVCENVLKGVCVFLLCRWLVR